MVYWDDALAAKRVGDFITDIVLFGSVDLKIPSVWTHSTIGFNSKRFHKHPNSKQTLLSPQD